MAAELPPILSGPLPQQLRDLRDYLVRMAASLDTLRTEAESAASTAAVKAVQQQRTPQAEARAAEASLRSLIIKTADTVQHNLDLVTQELHEDYLAVSDFGIYQENINTIVTETARGVVESYDYEAQIRALSESLTAIRGEIRRGLITDPDTGETAMGIAIAEELRFTGNTQTEGGLVYYELEPRQTLGIYTSTGWQFWIAGRKCGWFNSVDRMLHVENVAVETSLTLGDGWEITMLGGLGIKYRGS